MLGQASASRIGQKASALVKSKVVKVKKVSKTSQRRSGCVSVASNASSLVNGNVTRVLPSGTMVVGVKSSQELKHYFHSSTVSLTNPWDGVSHQVLSMPALSPSMTSGNLAAWVKKEGDKVSAGDVLAEVETDKATVAWEATEDGYLAKTLVPAGTKNLNVGEPVVVIVTKKENVEKFANYTKSSSSSSQQASTPSSQPSTSTPQQSTPSSPPVSSSPKPSVSHNVLTMPALSPTMEEGVIASWKKKEGDKVSAGDVLAEVETDKATVAFEATEDGFLARILVQSGPSRVKVNTPVAIIVSKQSDIPAVKDYNQLHK